MIGGDGEAQEALKLESLGEQVQLPGRGAYVSWDMKQVLGRRQCSRQRKPHMLRHRLGRKNIFHSCEELKE